MKLWPGTQKSIHTSHSCRRSAAHLRSVRAKPPACRTVKYGCTGGAVRCRRMRQTRSDSMWPVNTAPIRTFHARDAYGSSSVNRPPLDACARIHCTTTLLKFFNRTRSELSPIASLSFRIQHTARQCNEFAFTNKREIQECTAGPRAFAEVSDEIVRAVDVDQRPLPVHHHPLGVDGVN